jgi:hypothetical protein
MDKLQQAKCRVSPTDAHHWWIYGKPSKLQSYCIHCGREGPQLQGVYGEELYDYGQQQSANLRAQAKEAALHTTHDSGGKL